jgi:hypothetical protein
MWHEDNDTKRRESVVADILRDLSGQAIHCNSNYAGTDYLFYSKKHSRYMYGEFKSRNCNWNKYDDWMLEQGKFGQVVPHLQTGVGFQYIIATYDKLAIWTALHASSVSGFRRDIGGRVDRGDDADVKLCIYIPANKFWTTELNDEQRRRLWNP